MLLQKISNEFKKGEEKGEVPREFKQGREKKGGSSRDRARGAYMQGNTQNIPIVICKHVSGGATDTIGIN